MHEFISAARAVQAEPLYQQLKPAFSSVHMLDVNQPGRVIPQSFMGFSHEWPYVEELYTIPQYMEIIKLLQSYGSGPLVLRVGGGSTDKQDFVPGQQVWQALSKLNAATGEHVPAAAAAAAPCIGTTLSPPEPHCSSSAIEHSWSGVAVKCWLGQC